MTVVNYTHICPKCHEPSFEIELCTDCGAKVEAYEDWGEHQRPISKEMAEKLDKVLGIKRGRD